MQKRFKLFVRILLFNAELIQHWKMFQRQIETRAIFRRLFMTWRVLGIILWPFNKYLRIIYDILMNIFITFAFPVHLTLGVIFSSNQEQFFTNLIIGIASVSCTFKHLLWRSRLAEMQQINEILAQLDDRVRVREDYEYYKRSIERLCNFMINFFTRCYFSVGVTALFIALITGELLYPAFMPLQWRTSFWNYVAAILFQFVGVMLQIVQNIANDVYGPVVLCMISGHVHLLANRVSRVGHDTEENTQSNYEELSKCIEDHKLLMR